MFKIKLLLRDRLPLDDMPHVMLLDGVCNTNFNITTTGVNRIHTVEVSHIEVKGLLFFEGGREGVRDRG